MEKKRWYHSKCLWALLLVFGSYNGHAQVKPADLHYLDHIQGHWIMHGKHSIFTETWRQVDANTWKGVTYHITGKDSVEMDQLQLVRSGNDLYFSIAAVTDPQTRKPVLFKMKILQENGFVAENPDCDYPQKIIYKWKDEKHMEAHFKGVKEKTFSEIIMEYGRD